MNFKIDMKVLFFLLLFYFTHQLEIYIIIMFFCFIHEIAHVIMAKILKFKIQEIELIPFGFSIKIMARIEDYNKKVFKSNMVELKKIFVAIAGPLINAILAVIFSIINIYFPKEIFNVLIYINILIFAFNFIPIFPLDGGRILKNIISIAKGRTYANIIVNRVSNISAIFLTAIASIIILYLKNIAILFIVLFIWYLVIIENRKFRIQMKAMQYMEFLPKPIDRYIKK